MNELEKAYQENKDSLDRLDPKADSWNEIKSALETYGGSSSEVIAKNPMKFPAIKIAAVFIAFIGLASIFMLNEDSNKSSIYKSLVEAAENESLIDPEGSPTSFDPSQHKYTLVQFWSSGNALCVEENCYYYLPAYEKYKEKGFEIYAVSLDSELANWVSGIENNNLPWSHASDLKGWDSPICEECNISKVPSSYLLDNNGELLAKDLDAKKLESTLANLFSEK